MKKAIWTLGLILYLVFAFAACDGGNTTGGNAPSSGDVSGGDNTPCTATGSAGLEYDKHPDGKSCTVTGIGSCTDKDVIIPAVIDGMNVTSIKGSAFSSCDSLTSISLPSSVTTVGDGAFNGCDSLTSISLPSGVTSIGSSAFYGCDSLTSISIPSSVTSIGGRAFYNCSSLTSVTFQVNSQLTSIGSETFEDCSSLTSISVPASVTSIGYESFHNCLSLTSVTFQVNSQLTSIGAYAFKDCTKLASITIPNSVTSIDVDAFYGCTSIQTVTMPTFAISYILKTNLKTVIITKGECISSSAFRDCFSLTSITIPSSVTSIGDCAFFGCSSLTSITIGENSQLTSIGYEAFYNCSSLKSISIPPSVTSIGEKAFEYCSNLTSISIPSSVTSIGSYAFSDTGYYNNESNWENGVLYIDNHLIKAKDTLSGVYTVKAGVLTIADAVFEDCSSLTSISFGDNSQLTNIGDYAFWGCTRLSSIIIPASVTSIGEDAFLGCTRLSSIIIPASVTSIGEDAFKGCAGLSSIVVEKGNTSYHRGGNCLIETASKTLILGCKNSVIPTDGSVTSIGNSAFYGCTGLSSITIPANVTSIGEYAFYDCDSLTSISIPSSVTRIGNSAFFGCSSLASINIHGSATRIGYNAFSGTGYYNNENNWDEDGVLYIGNHLIKAKIDTHSNGYTVKAGTLTIADRAFADLYLEYIAIHDSVTSIGNHVFFECPFLTSIYYGGTRSQWNSITEGSDGIPAGDTVQYNAAT